ncbi:hypothetical protein CBR_g36700 [Chara braunii]|uniref:HAT C-terminal dimerisation domain-containing protein n=1 Tax=Chara braunii TaxID=69332 RepID=A0A388LLJ0_CHABU|nr:hypothetical protein CBR_g36700 [Chara braunii]|eukprot:GBG83082.1 hypothetical protein CBR_g36700 [Chara braunii]
MWHFVARGRYLDGSTMAGRKSGRRCLCRFCGRSICGGAKAAKEHLSKSEKFQCEAATPAVWYVIWSKDMTKYPKEFTSAIETLQSLLPGHPSLHWPPLRFPEDAVPPLVPANAPSGPVASRIAQFWGSNYSSHELTQIVGDDRWRKTIWSTSKIRKDAAEVTACIGSPPWWEDLRALCKMLEPIMDMLRLVDSDTRQINKILRRYEETIASCLSACRDIDRDQQDAILEVFLRRRTMFKTPAHMAAMLPDPEFRDTTLCDDAEVQQALVEALVKFGYPEGSPQHRKVQRAVPKLHMREPPFNELTMQRAVDIFDHPASFWSSKKAKFPHTAVFAGKILRIWATASQCERALFRWSFIHSKSRNRLEVLWAEKLVLCHWNLRLLDRPSLCDDGVGERPDIFGKWVHYWQVVEDEAVVDQQLVRGTGALAKPSVDESVKHIMGLILEGIGGIDWVVSRIAQATLVTRFFKRHGHAREVLEAYSKKTLQLPAETRFSTNVIMMTRLVELRAELTPVVGDDRWRDTVWSTSKIRKDAAEVTACIGSPPWWEDLRVLCKMLEPIMDMLRLVDSDTRQISKILRRYEETIASCLSACRDIDRDQQDAIVEVFLRRHTMFKTPAHTAAMLLDPEFRCRCEYPYKGIRPGFCKR